MNYRNRIANKCHEYEAAYSSKDWGGRISRGHQKAIRAANRRAKRIENRMALKDQAF
jgi:hypothetical protein